MAAVISLTKTDGWCQLSVRPSLVHFSESRSPSSRGSCFTADSQLTKQGELLRPHFRALFIGSTINAMYKHLRGKAHRVHHYPSFISIYGRNFWFYWYDSQLALLTYLVVDATEGWEFFLECLIPKKGGSYQLKCQRRRVVLKVS